MSRTRRILVSCAVMIACGVFLFALKPAATQGLFDEDPVLSAKVTLSYRDADLVDVLRSISEEEHINIISGPNVTGKVTTNLSNVTLKEALESILSSNGYTYVKQGTIFIITPIATEKEKAEAKKEMLVRAFELHCISAEDVKSAVSKLLTKDGIIETFSRTKESGEKGRSNFLIVSDISSVVNNIAAIIKSLDVRPPQVIIETRILDVSLDTTDKLGIKWNVTSTITGASAPTTLPFDKSGSPITNTLRTSGNLPTVAGTGSTVTSSSFQPGNYFPNVVSTDFVFGRIDFSKFSAVIDFLEQSGKVKTIAAPKIAAIDNEEAQITVGQNIPIPTYELNKDTGVLVVTGYEEQKVGIILKVTPHVVEKDYITMRLAPSVSSLTGKYVGPNNERPITETREALTVITIKDSETIAIGGLMKEQEEIIDTSVPFLRKLPIVGAAFRHKSKVISKKNLVILVSPHIVRDGENFAPPEKQTAKKETKPDPWENFDVK